MFEKAKFEKIKKANSELSLVIVYAPLDSEKNALKQFKKVFREKAVATKDEKTNFLELHGLFKEIDLELCFGDIMDSAFMLKTGDSLKIKVNEAEYDI